MRLYPAIDLKDGQCVRLKQGDYEVVTVYSEDPVRIAQEWEKAGGDVLHVVDLDGAKAGKSINNQVIADIVKAVKMPVEVGGGIRNLKAIEEKLSLGVSRVILGSAAVKEPELVAEAIKRFGPERVVVGVDAKSGKVAVEGWLEVTHFTALSFCQSLEKIGVTTVIYTDIAKDGMLQGPNVAETKRIIEATHLKVVASGGVSTLEDLKTLADIGCEGAIIGKALYTKAIDLAEAVTVLG